MGTVLSKVLARPTVKVTKIKLRGASPLAGKISADVTLSITNPNPIALHAKTFHYRVSKKSNDARIAEGRGEPFVARGYGDVTEVVTPVKFRAGGIGSAGKSLVLRGSTRIVFSGSIVFDAPMAKDGSVTVPFRGEQVIVME
mmetsp:Transcript_19869/g.47724  ORF Transcript_19869/g.47724 Transcript_19869/m.47724 type:complete len:142 (+) Transcript_19869:1189-1614(+)